MVYVPLMPGVLGHQVFFGKAQTQFAFVIPRQDQ
jgi:hypothetical protein